MCANLDLARYIVSILPTALDTQVSHRSLVAFTTGTLAEYISRLSRIDEGILAFLLPACRRMFSVSDGPGSKDVVVCVAIALEIIH